MLNSFKKNWELIASYVFIILSIAMLLYGESSCAGAGCAFAVLVAIALLFISVIFVIVALVREIFSKEVKKLTYILIALAIYAIIIFYILQNTNI